MKNSKVIVIGAGTVPTIEKIEFLMIQRFIDDNHKWTLDTFPGGTTTAALEHLHKEVRETIEAIENESPEAQREEFADCFLLLMNAAKKHGLSFSELFEAAMDKMTINRARKWGKPNELGFVEHVEEDTKHLGTCLECKKRPAITDYNEHGHFVCRPCLESLSRHFEEEYR